MYAIVAVIPDSGIHAIESSFIRISRVIVHTHLTNDSEAAFTQSCQTILWNPFSFSGNANFDGTPRNMIPAVYKY